MEANKKLFSGATNSGSASGIKETVLKYLSHFPLFILSLLICFGIGMIYLLYATPQYNVIASILLKNDQNNASSSNPSNDLLVNVLSGNYVNLNNEIQVIHSAGLMERVVSKNQLNILYFKWGKFKNTELYLDAPFRLIAQDSVTNETLSVTLSQLTDKGLTIGYGKGYTKTLALFWGKPFKVNGNHFIIVPQANIKYRNEKYTVTLAPVSQIASDILSDFTVEIADIKTSIIKLSLLTENVKKGKDILNGILKEYDQSNMEEKNAIAQNTIRFIDDRLESISHELSGVEGNLENYQGNNQLINVESQSSQSFENSNDISKNLTDINIQQGVIEMIQKYFNNADAKNNLVPSSLGINDKTLASLIDKYNELQLKKQREMPLLASNSLTLQDLTNQINDLKGNILESLQNIQKNLTLQENSLRQKNRQYQTFLSALPHNQKVMQDIKRKQTITEGLYLYLLQKREEAALSASSSNVFKYKQIDSAQGSQIPAKPKPGLVKILSVMIGLLLPVGWIRLGEILNDKVSTREDITSRLKMPVMGEIGHIPKRLAEGILIMKRDLIGEQLRVIRTNLSLLKKDKRSQVILITSAVIGEGKSLVSINLAAILALPGKKVALLELDFRRPDLVANLQIIYTKGLANYLNGETSDLSQISVIIDDIPTLHLFPSGSVSKNPGDILLDKKTGELFEALKLKYDYIIINSPPVGLVSDTFTLAGYSDIVLWIVRNGITLKKHLDFLNDLSVAEKLKNINIIINDIRTGGKYGVGYGYGMEYAAYGTKKKGLLKKLFS